MKKIKVISLGGSLIVPHEIDLSFLEKFKETIRKHYKKYKFVVVCGGGTIARKYIALLKKHGKSEKEVSLGGIRATRMNAEIMAQIFGDEANAQVPRSMKEIKSDLRVNNIVFCGALRYIPKETSDATTAKIAHYFKTDFINMTNVPGLFTSDPNLNKKAKLIPKISWKEFKKLVEKLTFKPGQHFVLDQGASKFIRKKKIPTYIIGKDIKNLDNLLKNKKFKGTTIEG